MNSRALSCHVLTRTPLPPIYEKGRLGREPFLPPPYPTPVGSPGQPCWISLTASNPRSKVVNLHRERESGHRGFDMKPGYRDINCQRSAILKGLSDKIDFKNVDEN
jgi:hypothetical protein